MSASGSCEEIAALLHNGNRDGPTEEKAILLERIRQLEHDLLFQKEERARHEVIFENEYREAEKHWHEKMTAMQNERDQLQIEVYKLRADVNEDFTQTQLYRRELEASKVDLQSRYETLKLDYDATMEERSNVLEELNAMSEERDRLKMSLTQLTHALHARQSKEAEQQRLMEAKLEAALARRSLHQDYSSMDMRAQLQSVTRERDEALRALHEKAVQSEPTAIVDQWSTLTFNVPLQWKSNLGLILEGGTQSETGRHYPIYVKDVLTGSPLESCLRRLDHIVMVNDIDVTCMDVRSLIDILRNSHHLILVVKRRTSLHRVVQLMSKGDLGVELSTGVFVNHLDKGGQAERSGIRLGNRLIYVNGVPVHDAVHAEELLTTPTPNGTHTLCFLNGAQRAMSQSNVASSSKQKTLFSKMQDKLFRRSHASSTQGTSVREKSHVVAVANIDDSKRGSEYFTRHGSLRLPSSGSGAAPFMRAASLRAPAASVDYNNIFASLHSYTPNCQSRGHSHSDKGTWPTTDVVEEMPRRRVPQRPSVLPVFRAPSPPPLEAERKRCSCSSPSAWSHSSSSPFFPKNAPRRTPLPSESPFSHVMRRAHRASTHSPLPQPPPYPGPRFAEDSMSSMVSSTQSMPHNTPTESDAEIRRVRLSKEDSLPQFGVGIENGSEGGVVISKVYGNVPLQQGDRLLDIGGINVRQTDSRNAIMVLNQFHASQDEVDITVSGRNSGVNAQFTTSVPRSELRLCGGNALGILVEKGIGELMSGDRVLKVDELSTKGATLEEATTALNLSRQPMVEVTVHRGIEGLEKLQHGSAGDGFYVRVNLDRTAETTDELDLKQGEIIFVDNTVFMGQSGRWRAWRVDREGRQRMCGIVPSALSIEDSRAKKNKTGRPTSQLGRAVYERVQRVSPSKRRPVILYGAILSPFIQALLEDTNKFTQYSPEFVKLSTKEVERGELEGKIIEAKRRDQMVDVVFTANLQKIVDEGLHCILDVSPAAISRMQRHRIFPIVIFIKFKSAKQIKDMKEELGEKLSSRQAKESYEKACADEAALDLLDYHFDTVVIGGGSSPLKNCKHISQQISSQVDHEQKRSVWVPV